MPYRNWINALRQALCTHRSTRHHQSAGASMIDPGPKDFGEAVGYLAWYVQRTPEYQLGHWPDGRPCRHLRLCHRYLMAWLRNQLDQPNTIVCVRGKEWSL